MSKSATKHQGVSGGRIAVMIISVLLLSFIMAFGMLIGISSLKHNAPVELGEDATTVRKQLSAEGANPTASSPLDNIGYMAYVMDNQPFYHAHAYNSTKSTGYEQVTQTWKDYKKAEVSGEDFDVMVASDLSYSALIKSSIQTCFIGDNEAHVRGGNKPGKNTKPVEISWSNGRPSVYDKNSYKRSYGEFSTEISVYVINEQTLERADEVVANEDGTYSQKFYLNENCGVWYQYKMKTNGGLKNYPEFKRVEITFTFDKDYQILESYCEERAIISPRALGGMNMSSDSKTTTRYDYTQEGFDEQHFAYYKDFFKNYVGSKPDDNTPVVDNPGVVEILGSGFSKVVAPDGSGQQFKLAIRLGETDYDGRIFASLSDMNDILNTLDARFELEKRGSGRQDLYAEFKKGKINVYYSNNFALTTDIDSVSSSVSNLVELINKLLKDDKKTAVSFALTDEEKAGGLDVASLLDSLKLDLNEKEATIKLKTDDLLGLGVGVDLAFGFDRIIEEDGGSLFSVKSLDLNYINYKGTPIDISAEIVPDNDGKKIERNPAESVANLADYVDSVYSILNSKTVKLDLGLEDKLIEGLTLDASAYLTLGSAIAAKVDVSASYKGISLKLDASYEIDTASGDYGNVYLHVSEINGTAVNARVYCNVKDTVKSIQDIIAIFKGGNGDAGSETTPDDVVEEAKNELAEIINKVLNLNFEKIVGSLNGNAEKISLEVDVDEILRGLDVSLGVEFGKLSLSVEKADPKIHGYVSSLGVTVDITGSENVLILDKENYVDIKAYIDGVKTLLSSTSYEVAVKLQGTKLNESVNLEGLYVDGTAKIALKDGQVKVALPVYVSYNEYAVNLTAYYTVSLSGGDYGDIYLDVEKMTVKTSETESKDIELNAKVYCDINGAADTIKAIISRFKPSDGGNGENTDTGVAAAAEEEGGSASIIARAIETLLKLDYNEIIYATNDKLTVNVNVDEILAGMQISLGGISFGDLHLEYVTKTGALSGTLQKLGLSLDIVGTDKEVTLTDGAGYVNLNTYLESVNKLLNRNSYVVKVLFDGKEIEDSAIIADTVDLKKLYVDATAKAAIVDGNVLVDLPAVVGYDGYKLTFSVFYTIDLSTKNYGTVYLSVSKFETPEAVQELDAKVYCDIKNVIDAVNAIIGKFKSPSNSASTYASIPSKGELLTNAISLLLSLDYKQIIHATNEQLTVNLDVDSVLEGLKISLGGIKFGNLNLEFATETGALSGSLDKLGLTMSVEGSDEVLKQIDASGYVDLGAYVTSLKELLNKTSYNVKVDFDGKNLPADITAKLPEYVNLNTLTLNLQAQIAFTGSNFNGVDVAINNLELTYENVSLVLAARYSVNFDGTYGTVYLTVKSVNGTTVTGANVTCNLDEAAASVERIIALFTKNDAPTDVNNTDNAGTYASSTADIISKVLNIVLKLDFNALLNADADKATVKIDLDSVLESFNLGVTLGTLTLEYSPESYTFTATDNGLGLTLLSVVGSDSELAGISGDYIDVNDYIDSVEALINSKTYEVVLHMDGKKLTDKIDLTGLTLDVTAYVQAQNNFTKFDICVPVTIDCYGVSLKFVANYSIDTSVEGLGAVYLTVTEINGTAFDAKVYGDVDEVIAAVQNLINRFKTNSPDNAGTYAGNTNDIISKVIDIVLGLDYANIIKGTQEQLQVTLDVDSILSKFDISLAGIAFGDLTLTYNVSGLLEGTLEELGVTASVKGNENYVMPELNVKDYLNVTDLINIADGMIAEGKKIEKAKDVAFTVNANFDKDASKVAVAGFGEVIWKDDNIKVAVSLDVTVDETEKFALNFTFDKSAMNKTSELPVAVLSIGSDAVKIFVKDTSNLVNSFKHLIEAFTGNKNSQEVREAPDSGSGYAVSVGGYTLEELLKNENVKKALGAIVGFISDCTVEIVDGDVDKLVAKYSDKVTVTLCDSNYLSFKAQVKSLTLTASAEAGEGATYGDIAADLADEKTKENADGKYTYYDLLDFIEAIYNGFFDYVENELSFSQFLNGKGYSVDLSLIGKNSGIEALEGVEVNAKLYYDEGLTGNEIKNKLLHVELDLDISGTKVLASVSYKGQTLYLKLTQIGNTELKNIAFRTDIHNVYAAAEELVRFVTETDLVDTVNKFLGNGAAVSESDKENLSAFAMQRTDEGAGATSTLTKVIDAILKLDLNKSFVFNKDEGTAKINIDSLSEALLGVKFGTVKASVNSADKSLTASVTLDKVNETDADNKPWLTLNGTLCEVKTDVINPADYMNIGFASTLIGDLVDTLTKNNHVHDLYTFTGRITVPVSVSGVPILGSINLTLEFNNATITVGLDENDDFYFTLAASMKKCTYAGFTVTEGRDISITYSNGYIVLGRNIGSGSEIYKICTLNYLLDTLLDKNNSPARWLLGTSDTVWGILVDQLKLDLSSGLTKPKTYTLYEQLQQNASKGEFNLKKMLSGFTAKTDGKVVDYNGGAPVAIEKLSLTDNYYAFDINAKDLTGGVLTELCAVLLRTPKTEDSGDKPTGITGIKAYGAIGSMVSFNIDFSTYLEGEKDVYGGTTPEIQAVAENVITKEEDLFTYEKVKESDVTESNVTNYYVFNEETQKMEQATELTAGAIYYERNTSYFVKDGENYVPATGYTVGTKYYEYVAKPNGSALGTVAVRNYFAYASTLNKDKPFNPDQDFNVGNTTPHINKIFGCYNTEDGTHETSDILETIYLDVYSSVDATVPERTVEVLYGSTVHLISDFPEFADKPANTQRLIYLDKDGNTLANTIYIKDNEVAFEEVDGKLRVKLYKSERDAYQVIFHIGVGDVETASAAFVNGETLPEYPLNDVSFLGWYKEKTLKTKVNVVVGDDAEGNVIHVYGKFITTLYKAPNGINYSFDTKLDNGKGGYFVSGVNDNIEKYYNNADEWLKIESEINGYTVYYIGREAFANKNDDVEHSLVNVLVPETVVAIYDNAFLDNKGLRQVVVLGSNVFFGGRADSSDKTSAFYGCYLTSDISGNVNTLFTVYYNGIQDNPYRHISTTNIAVDTAWNRIYFNGNKNYTMKTQSSGWAYVEFTTTVENLDGSSTLPEGVDLSNIIHNGVYFTNYPEAGNLANAISASIKSQIENRVYEVYADSPVQTNGKRYSVNITITEYEKVLAPTNVTFIVEFDGKVLYNNTQTVDIENTTFNSIFDGLTFDETVTDISKNDYEFLGWYTEKGFASTATAPDKNNGKISTLYARIVPKTVTKANGVTYTFSKADEKTKEVHYKVSGFDFTKSAYTTSTNPELLVIENVLYGLNVTQIADNAFNAKGKGATLKRILVPSNVKYIGKAAFFDNKDIMEVIFLAEQVEFGGSIDGRDYPFYGCSVNGDDTKSVLNIYYNTTAMMNDDWLHFKTDGSKILSIGGGNDTSSFNGLNTWGFIDIKVIGSPIELKFNCSYGLVESEINYNYIDNIEANVISQLNQDTATKGVIYKYTVKAVDDFDFKKDGIHHITVTITENSSDKLWNKVELDSASNIQIDFTASEIETVKGIFFAKANTNVTIKSLYGNLGLTNLTVYADANKTDELEKKNSDTVVSSMFFTMPSRSVYVTATSDDYPITEVKFISAIKVNESSFKQDGTVWSMTDTAEENQVLENIALSAYTVSSTTDYKFIGWAYVELGVLKFESAITHTEYYAVWMYNRAEISKVEVKYGEKDGEITAEHESTLSSGIAGWYKYTYDADKKPTYEQKVQLQSLTVETTVINPRMKYKLTISKSGDADLNDDNGTIKASGCDILDGEKIWLDLYHINDDRLALQVLIQSIDNKVTSGVYYGKYGAYVPPYTRYVTKIENISLVTSSETYNIGTKNYGDTTASSAQTSYRTQALMEQHTVSSNITLNFSLPKYNKK